MALTDDLKPALWQIRAIPGLLGLRPHTVEVAVGSWSGGATGHGTETQAWALVTEASGQNPKVRWLNDEEVALSQMPAGSCDIGPITPSFSGGGTALAALTGGSATVAQTFLIRITGPRHPNGATYRLTQSHEDRALQYMLRATPIAAG